jgi:hypothetical protein
LGGDTFIFLGLDAFSVIENSKWTSRGWKFQELLLSKRALIFCPDQVTYFSEMGFRADDVLDRGHCITPGILGATIFPSL